MPQLFYSLRCCSCEVFQVHQSSKSKKWSCKICRQKQSYKNIYFEGNGADCRKHVQHANMLRAKVELTCDISPKSRELESKIATDQGDGLVAVPASKWDAFASGCKSNDSDSEDNEWTQIQPGYKRKLKDTQPTTQRKTTCFSGKQTQPSGKENFTRDLSSPASSRDKLPEHASRWVAYGASNSSSECED